MKKRSISILLLVTILLQNCSIYEKTSVSLNDAQNVGIVKVIPTYGQKIYYKNIELRDSVYYGIAMKDKNGITLLYQAQISSIFIKDLKKSKRLTIIMAIAVPVVIVGLLAWAIATSSTNLTLDLSGFVWPD